MAETPLQHATPERAEVVSVEWLFEPEWPGRRLTARLGPDGVSVNDADGAAVDGDDAVAVATVLGAGLAPEGALVEGVWTSLADTPRGPAFAAVDLLELDGESLLAVPFAERRRLLESIVTESERLRLGPVVKHPVARWLDGWKAAGFTHYLARHQNSAYLPGEVNPECLQIAIGPAPAPGMMARFVGTRERTRRVRD